MKKLFLLGLMTMLTCSAWAEWVRAAESNKTTLYFDPATISKDGNIRTVLILRDLKQREPSGSISHIEQLEYDCKNERGSVMSKRSYSMPMAGGELLKEYQFSGSDWFEIPPRAVGYDVLKIVCR